MESIIYIPGLGTRLFNQSVESFAYRFKKALDINDPDKKKHFETEFRKINFGKDNKQESNVATIFVMEDGKKKIAYEIYELDYGKTLTDKFEKSNIFVKTFLLFISIIIKIPDIIYQFLRSLFKKKQNPITLSFKDILQFTYGAFVLLLLSIFGIILVLSLISYLPDFFQMNKIQDPAGILKMLNTFKETAIAKYIIGISTLLFLILPNAKNFITILATEYLCTMYYLNFGERRQNIIGKLEELTECISEGNDSERISFYCYSFGSIIAADALFPFDGKASYRIASSVKILVSIGSPIDFIKVYWPSYFAERKKANNKLKKWYNIYSNSDILSSNFRFDDKELEAKYGIAEDSILPTNIPYNILNSGGNSFISTALLLGFKANQLYWDDEVYSASCFTNLILRMREDKVLDS
ncbi:MAG TPA: hypothetical protein PKC91_00160 [Ignavibacteria bacterium]|nr:hypothetical protein [Ignavibacteria bacterium]